MSTSIDRLVVGGYAPDGIAFAQRQPAGAFAVTATVPVPDASFVIAGPDGMLYAVGERAAGTVSAVRDGRVVATRSTGGAFPCHLCLTPDGRYLVTADYGEATGGAGISVHPVSPDGGLGERTDRVEHGGGGPHPDRQLGSHVHQVLVDPAGRVLAVDLGTDSVYAYRLVRGRLEPAGRTYLPPGCGPRHLVIAPDATRAYVVTELAATLLECAYDPVTGIGPVLSETALTPGVRNQPAELLISADGRYLYVSNRGPDSISVLATDGATPTLVGAVPTGGAWPRHLAFGPGGLLFAANQEAGTVVTFRIDPVGGMPSPTGAVLDVPAPACVLVG